MAIQKEFVLRYRGSGHVRFQIPQKACEPRVANAIVEQLLDVPGVSSAHIYQGARKLSIRYDEIGCSFQQLAIRLFKLLADMERDGWFASVQLLHTRKTSVAARLKRRIKQAKVGRWFDEKVHAVKETAHAAKVLGRLTTKGPKAVIKDPEKAVIDFLNDILVLYLIKTHWTRITQQWLVRPFVHRYEWLATFYLFFLLVRSRRPK
ncbi:MAG: hypothetical protein KGZ80_00830 [Methylomonas sp.]|nr:hypothetical protein [Methylomonas sp.]PPD19693.1 MAG: hypothetical protein CTY23_11215 [Methylomonas sp.]PPD25809.1 MAG: hypothetical protein CTY22_07165 [Methylomonas sp.]PPD37268.1 MAG: hypothetical protein CTY21_07165 [Methylomonas sp.]PPD39034.1 MAG: hypothetical protein CTY17_08505 [Methylomonas sp.]